MTSDGVVAIGGVVLAIESAAVVHAGSRGQELMFPLLRIGGKERRGELGHGERARVSLVVDKKREGRQDWDDGTSL